MTKTILNDLDPQTRDLDGARAWLRDKLDRGAHPFVHIDRVEAARVVDGLRGIEPEPWSEAWLSGASHFESLAEASEQAGDREHARDAWWQAYSFAFLGRYPVPNHPAKQAAYERTRTNFGRATALWHVPGERVEVPFAGGETEGDRVAFIVARPPGVTRPPVVIVWAGIDSWKEESFRASDSFWQRGIATIHVDMPGVGEAPVLAGVDAERMWDPIFDWIGSSDLDPDRVGLMGGSFGGYWATKLAHTRRQRLVAAVNWGGGIHLTFQPSWQEKSRHASSYLMDLMAARARIFGGSTFEDYVARCPELSLLDQGVLDGPSCPLLLVNGKDDLQNASADIPLALEHGDPKTARLYPGGHMGADMPVIRRAVTDWLARHLFPAGEHRSTS